MFCPKCGTKNEDTAKFCASCGAPLQSTQPAASNGDASSAQPEPSAATNLQNATSFIANHRTKLIAGAAVVVFAIVAVVLLATNVFGGNKLVNGKYIFEGNNDYDMSYEIYEEDGKQKIDIGYAGHTVLFDTVYYSGTFVEDGRNDQGTIWKLVPDEDGEDSSTSVTIRFQFPEGYGEGEVEGRWYLERTTPNGDGTSLTMISIMEFDEGNLALMTAYGEGALDGGLGVQDVIDNEVSDREDIPEGKYYIYNKVDTTIEREDYDWWLKYEDEGDGKYSIESFGQDGEGHITYSNYPWMDVNIDPQE